MIRVSTSLNSDFNFQLPLQFKYFGSVMKKNDLILSPLHHRFYVWHQFFGIQVMLGQIGVIIAT